MNQMWFNVGYMLDKWFRDIRGSLSTRGNRGRRLLGLDRAKRVFYSVWSARLNYNWVDHGMVFGSQVLRVWIPHTYLQQWKGEGERFVQQGSLPTGTSWRRLFREFGGLGILYLFPRHCGLDSTKIHGLGSQGYYFEFL